MIHMTNETQILLASEPADFRKGLDGFIALCQLSLAQNPRSEARFVFINKNKTMIRVLSFDGTGFWLMTKRLSKGKFQGWPSRGNVVSAFSALQLSILLKGKWSPAVPVKNAS